MYPPSRDLPSIRRPLKQYHTRATMRRSSNAVLQTQTSEPLIVVEDQEAEEDARRTSSSQQSSEDESPTMNPYLLSPYTREIRKHSLPTPQCSGITASQVRRLSERGECGPGPRQAEFLATLSSAPQPSPGGRRHSVVTISKVPSTIFGRNRRESVAAFPTGSIHSRVLPNRRESIACPPSTESRGSVHNLQLDIMDDIVQARKVRMKVWNTSQEKLCEVQPLDEAGGVQRYTNAGRRFSDFVGTTLPPIPSSSKRRASELPQAQQLAPGPASKQKSGIVCSNTDLISILSSLSASATEIDQCAKEIPEQSRTAKGTQERRSRLKSMRSNSFDVSVLRLEGLEREVRSAIQSPSSWFAHRHQPSSEPEKKASLGSKVRDLARRVVDSEPGKVVWDGRSGSLIDAHALGSAIEGFLKGGGSPDTPPTVSPVKRGSKGRLKANWFAKGEEEAPESCDSTICATLKDLFVK